MEPRPQYVLRYCQYFQRWFKCAILIENHRTDARHLQLLPQTTKRISNNKEMEDRVEEVRMMTSMMMRNEGQVGLLRDGIDRA